MPDGLTDALMGKAMRSPRNSASNTRKKLCYREIKTHTCKKKYCTNEEGLEHREYEKRSEYKILILKLKPHIPVQ